MPPPKPPQRPPTQGNTGMDPFTLALLAAGPALQGIGGMIAGSGQEKLQKEGLAQDRMAQFIELLKHEAARRQANTMGQNSASITAPLASSIVSSQASGGVNRPFSPVTALLRPQTFQANPNAPAGQGGVSLEGPGGPQASPEELQNLLPNFQQFQALREQGRLASENITPEKLFTPQEGVLGELNNFQLTRGEFLSNDNSINESIEEQRAQALSGVGRDPGRGPLYRNQRGDFLGDADVSQLNQLQQEGRNEELMALLEELRKRGAKI